ncbi:MAG: hypothetical protein AB7G21_03955, partial [Dehalococcoidia bacterium]
NVHVPDGTRNLTRGCGPVQKGLFVRGRAPDVNNRVCKDGRLFVAPEQLGSGGLKPYVVPTPSPSKTPEPTATAAPSSNGSITSPAPGSTVSGGVLVLARASGGLVTVQWGEGTSPGAWRSLAATPIGPGEYYAGWNTSALRPGIYTVRLLVNGEMASAVLVRVAGEEPTPTTTPLTTPPPTRR